MTHCSETCRYALSVVGLFLLAMLQEFLISYRASIGMKAAKPASSTSADMNVTLTGGRCEFPFDSITRMSIS